MKKDSAKSHIIESIENSIDTLTELAHTIDDAVVITADDVLVVIAELKAQIVGIKKLRSR